MGIVKIAVDIPIKAAVMGGQQSYGRDLVIPTEEQLNSLTSDERRIVTGFTYHEDNPNQRFLRICIAPANWGAVVEAVRHLLNKRKHKQQELFERMLLVKDREKYVESAAESLRRLPGTSTLSDRELIEHAVPALMEEIRDELVKCKVPADHIRIVPVDSSEYRTMMISERQSPEPLAAALQQQVYRAMRETLAPLDSDLFPFEAMVVRVRQRSKIDWIARRATTCVVGILGCLATSPIALIVNADSGKGEP